MIQPALWICFYDKKGTTDQWSLGLDAPTEAKCHNWQVSGGAFEFVVNHSRGTRCETLPDFKEKWLIKADLTDEEATIIEQSVTRHPVDNEGEFWDCRVYCFELLGILEEEEVLERHDGYYNIVRKKLHNKWKTEDGVNVRDEERQGEEHCSEDEPSQHVSPGVIDAGNTEPAAHETSASDPVQRNSPIEGTAGNRKRTLSHGSGNTSRSRDQTTPDQCTGDLGGKKRQKDL